MSGAEVSGAEAAWSAWFGEASVGVSSDWSGRSEGAWSGWGWAEAPGAAGTGASGAGAAWSARSGEAWAGLEAEGLASSASSGRPATWRGGGAVSPPGRESGSREVVTTVSLGCRASRWAAAGHEAPCLVPSVGTGQGVDDEARAQPCLIPSVGTGRVSRSGSSNR